MEEIRCPMCGRPNPADRDVCQFCEARLKPLTGPIGDRDVPPPSQPEEDDWLGSLRSESDMADSADSDWSEAELEADSEHQRDPLDWLSNIDEHTGPGSVAGRLPEEPQEPASAPEMPAASEPEEEQVDLSAWLASLDEEQPAEEPVAREESPDWLREFETRQAEPAPEPDEDDLPDWLTGLDAEEARTQTTESAETPEHLESEEGAEIPPDLQEDLPDWLAGIQPQEPSAPDETPAAELWQSVEGSESSADQEPPPAADLPPEESATGFEAAVPAEPESSDLESDLPDWLSDFDAEPPVEAAEDEAQPDLSAALGAGVVAGLAGDLFDFQDQADEESSLAADEGAPGDFEEHFAEASPAEIEEPVPLDADESLEPGEMPDWLADLGPAEPLDEPGKLTDSDLPAPTQETADWLSDLASDIEGSGVEAPPPDDDLDSPFTYEGAADEMSALDLSEEPEWLAELDEQAGEALAGEGQEDIARADLPEWLAAMRPVDSIVTPRAVPEETGMDVESAGPLSGLQDVLPAELEVFQIGKPEVQSVKLNTTDSQQKHILMLNQMLKEEAHPAAAVTVDGLGAQRILRWLIALVLLAAALFGTWSGFSISEMPIPPAEVLAVNQAIDALPAQAPVLVAFDYEPGLSGEMDPLAASLLDHLMLRGAALTLVSTSTTGPILGEAVIQDLQEQHNYQRGVQYVNLGYIPGGPTGLQSFSSFPIQLILPYTFSGYEAWEPRLAPLAGVEQLSDYALVLVLTDRQETARSWVEQVGPAVEQAPLLFGTSAQIAPYIRPYYAGTPNLVDGYVSGITGSGAYERLTGVAGWTSDHWDAYTLLVLVAVVVILVGGLINLVLGSRRQTSNAKGELDK